MCELWFSDGMHEIYGWEIGTCIDSFCFPNRSRFLPLLLEEGMTLIGFILGLSPINTLWLCLDASRKLSSFDLQLNYERSGLFLRLLRTRGIFSSWRLKACGSSPRLRESVLCELKLSSLLWSEVAFSLERTLSVISYPVFGFLKYLLMCSFDNDCGVSCSDILLSIDLLIILLLRDDKSFFYSGILLTTAPYCLMGEDPGLYYSILEDRSLSALRWRDFDRLRCCLRVCFLVLTSVMI